MGARYLAGAGKSRMSSLVVAASGLCFFLAAYIPFSIWEELILAKKDFRNARYILKKEYEDLFRLKTDKEVLKEVLLWGGLLALFTFIAMPGPITGVIFAVLMFFVGIHIPLILATTLVKEKDGLSVLLLRW